MLCCFLFSTKNIGVPWYDEEGNRYDISSYLDLKVASCPMIHCGHGEVLPTTNNMAWFHFLAQQKNRKMRLECIPVQDFTEERRFCEMERRILKCWMYGKLIF